MATVQELAKQMSQAFEGSTRTNGEGFRKLKEGSPDWMTDVIRKAHSDGNTLPDDQRYAFIEEACDLIADADDLDGLNMEADTYTYDLTKWLNSRVDRVYWLTEALEQYGDTKDGFQLLALAQLLEKEEVLYQVKDALELEAMESEEE